MSRTRILALVLVLLAGAPALAGPPAKIADSDPGQGQAMRSFERFAASWMSELKRMESQARAAATREGSGYRSFGPDYAVSLKPTGNATAPWVGMIRYPEHEYACRASGCSRAVSRNVTEVFRFQGGRWVY